MDIENDFTYHSPTDEQKDLYLIVRELARGFAYRIREFCLDGFEKNMAYTRLSEVVFWTNAAIARHGVIG